MAVQLFPLLSQHTTLLDYQGGKNPIYIGLADPKVAPNTNTAVWQIKKITYDSNSNPTAIQWANGSTDFDQVWANHTSLNYQ